MGSYAEVKRKNKMKKLLIITVLAICGAVANAATVNWSANAIQSSPDVSVAAGWLVQIYASTVDYSYDSAKAGSISTWATGSTVAAGTTFRATGSGSQSDGSTASYYAVIYDASSVAAAKNYIVSDNVSVTTPANGASVNLAFGAMTATTTANKFLNSSWTAVPEPTSGLLMLLGMAGLALRRRRA